MKNGFVGTKDLLRLILRLDRIKLTLWLAGIAFLVAITPFSIRTVTNNEAEAQGITPEMALAQQAVLVGTSGASIALQGPPDALETFGGRYAFEIGAFTFAIIGLMNVLLIARHTRAEEESGRAELVRAAAVGPWSSIAAVSIVALAANLFIALVTTIVFAADGLDPGRSFLFGAALGLCGLVFAAVALVWVQVFEYGRAATGASLAVIAVAFALRAVGDVQENGLSYLSPIGWSQAINPFGQPVVWPIVILVVATAMAFAVAILLVLRRDVGAGLIDQRPGPEVAASSLLSPLGLAWRLQRNTLAWWCVGIAFMGATYGSVLSEIESFIEEMESMRDVLEQMGMTGEAIRDGFLTLILSMIALIAGAGVIQSMLRPRGEELAGRAEPVLAGHVSRTGWLGAHLVLTVLAAPVFMVVAALSVAASDAAITGQLTDLGGVVGAALVRTPALWAVAGVGVLLYGLAKEYTLGVWAAFALTAFVFLFGELVRLPDMALNLSPLRHVTHLPGGDQGGLALVVLSLIGLTTFAGGMALFTRRDIG